MKNIKHFLILWLQGNLVLLLSCTGNNEKLNSINSKKQDLKSNTEIALIVQKWQSDSLGCLKLRNKGMAESIIDTFKLEKSSEENFLKVFGKPNLNKKLGEMSILRYYFDSFCGNGKFIDSMDYCIAEFTFMKDKLDQRNYICQ